MSQISITVNATNALNKLEKLVRAADASEKIVQDLSDEMADNIVTIAKGLVPVDTGNLQESIHYVGAYPSYNFTADAKDTSGIPYGVFVEYGTSKKEPQPFIEPAVVEGLRDAKTVMKQEILRFIGGK